MPLRMPVGIITPTEADERLASGDRRTGEFVYKTKCPTCRACEPIRIRCPEYRMSRNQRRVFKRNERDVRTEMGPLVADDARVELFNRHRRIRGLAKRDTDIDLEEYIWGFVRSCFDSFEISYWIGTQLAGIAICDKGLKSMSAVYTFFEPDLKRESLGTYSILKQIDFCAKKDIEFLYLGYYVARSPHMQYKERFSPQERLVDGNWIPFD